MYLSQLHLNARNRGVNRDLGSPYELHRTLLRAFPNRDDGGPGRVLFRVEPSRGEDETPAVLVQSEREPDWRCLVDARYAQVEGPKVVSFVPNDSNSNGGNSNGVRTGDRFRFRLLANPTVKREGKRHGLMTEEQQIAWLARKGDSGGFAFDRARVIVIPVGLVRFSRRARNATSKISHHAVRFEGLLRVTSPEGFISSLTNGIGPAKAFGFGLLSIAPN